MNAWFERWRTTALPAAVLLAALVVAWAIAAGGRGGTPVAPPMRALPPDSEFGGPIAAQQSVGPYQIRVYSDTAAGDEVLDIKRAGRRVYARRGEQFALEHVGEHLTSDRLPGLVVSEYTGGLHCCTRVTVLGLGPAELRDYGTIEGGDGDVEFEDLDGDGIPEVRVGDWRFAYWRDTPFSDTPVPAVILRFRGDGYRVACDLMRTPAPDSAELARKARRLSSGWESSDPPTDLWAYGVDLVYGGHPDLAWKFFDMAWPSEIPGKADFVRDLREMLTSSPCWSEPPPARPAT